MAFTAGFSVNVGDPTKASDVDVLAANDDYLKNAIDTFIANDANNRVLTGTGSGTANAETNLTFDGSTLTVTGTVSATTFSGNVTGGTISGSTGTFSGNVTISKDAPQLIMTDSGSGGGTSDIIIDAIGSNHGFYFRADGATNHVILESNGDFKVDADTLFVDASADRVGIGTSSPSTLLHIEDLSSDPELRIRGAVTSNPTITFYQNTADRGYVRYLDSGDILQASSAGAVQLAISGTSALHIANSRNVGISTVSPSTKLHVSGASSASALRLDETTSSANSYLGYIDTSGNFGIDVNGGGYLRFAVGGAERARITSAGNFEVTKSGSAEGLAKFESNDDVSIKLKSTFGASNGAGIFLEFDDAFTSATEAFYLGVPISSSEFGIGYGTKDAFTVANTKLTVTRTGNVGIGTASPNAPLAVASKASTYEGMELITPSGDANGFFQFGVHDSGGSAGRGIQFRRGGSDGFDTLSLEVGNGGEFKVFGQNFVHATNALSIGQEGSGLAQLRAYGPDSSTMGSYEFAQTSNDGSVSSRPLVIDNTGRVGIGTVSPSSTLNVAGTFTITGAGQQMDNGQGISAKNASGTLRQLMVMDGSNNLGLGGTVDGGIIFYTSLGNERLRITSAGNVGIGSQSPTYKLVVSNGGAAGYEFNVNGLNSGVNTLTYNRSTSAYVDSAHFVNNYYIYSGQTPAERFRVESTGVCAFMTPNINIRFNGTATQSVLTNNDGVEIYTGGYIWAGRQGSSLYLNRAGTTGEIAVFRYDASTEVGSISVTSTATAYNTSSDYRLKENLVPITGAVDRVNALQPRRFNFISDPDTTVDGFVAHEVSPIVPEAISGEKDAVDEDGNPEYQGIDQSKLVPLLTAAIQELTARIEALEAA